MTITIEPGISSPRCAEMTAGQRMRVVNKSGDAVDVVLAQFQFNLPHEGEKLVDEPVGTYLAPGVHRLNVSPCCPADIVLIEDAGSR